MNTFRPLPPCVWPALITDDKRVSMLFKRAVWDFNSVNIGVDEVVVVDVPLLAMVNNVVLMIATSACCVAK